MSDATVHVPVLMDEVLAGLEPKPGMTLVDGTAGGGGHARALAERIAPEGKLFALDRDPGAAEKLRMTLAGLPVEVVHANYADLPDLAEERSLPPLDGILLDLGLSSDQLADEERGFSYASEGSLDLRFDPEEGEPAWRLIEKMREENLANLIYEYGEERFSRRIARKIVETRRRSPIKTPKALAELVASCVPRARVAKGDRRPIHPATRTFQALRIAVNRELEWVEFALERFHALLRPGGRFAVISFHSLEDRLVKNAFRDRERWENLTKKPISPSDQEIARNPRSRSAKLRVAARR